MRATLLVLAAGLALSIVPFAGAQPPSQQGGQPAKSVAQATGDAAAPGIKRITLYRSGVAAIERRGLIDGNAKVQLRFTTEQINDILKSMFVLDLSKGQGRIDGISYGSREPLTKRLAAFGVDLSDNPAISEILARLRGTRITLRTPDGDVTGIVMNVETRPTIYTGTDKGAATKFDLPWVNLLTDKGVRSYNLTAVAGFQIADEALAAELDKALAAVAEYRADRTKTVDITCSGAGARELVIGYVQEAPAWKTSYRLVLPDAAAKDKDTPKAGPAQDRFTLQGWAIVENTTDEDWRDVTLSLVSGRPVSFQMDLYEPLYVFRPMVPVPTIPGVSPRLYEGGRLAEGHAGNVDKAAAPVMKSMSRAGSGQSSFRDANAPGAPPASPAAAPPVTGASLDEYAPAAQARAVEAGEVFQFQLDHPVTVERQRSAMLPIVNAGIEGRRVSIYSPADGSEHPMRGIEVTNSSGTQLMPGPITVFDGGAYAGDAQIGHVPAGDKRLLAYSVDLDVDVTRRDRSDETIRKIRVVKGTLETTVLTRATTTYAFTNKDQARARTILVEQPKWASWEVAGDVKPVEETLGLLRFETSVAAGKSVDLPVTLERVTVQGVALISAEVDRLVAYLKDGKISPAVMAAFQEAASKQAAIVDLDRQQAALEKERSDISNEQSRIRQNMGSIDRQSDLYATYVKKLTQQESRLETIAQQANELAKRKAAAQQDLDSFLANLNVE